MCSEVETFYGNLFNAEFEVNEKFDIEFLGLLQTNKVPERLHGMLTADISLAEAEQALRTAKRGKTPGIEGIPIEFYLVFWNNIGPEIVNVLNATLKREHLTVSQSEAVVKLIPKCKNPTKMVDFRPISLLCADYKLLALILARRLNSTLNYIISSSQRGGVPGRKVDDITIMIRDVINLLEEKPTTAAMATLDFEKAYDRVPRNVLWKVMTELGFPSAFLRMIKTLYADVTAVVSFGKGMTRKIQCTSSIRQGCPLSVPLFVCFIDPLLRALEKRVNGVPTVTTAMKVASYLDDVSVFFGNKMDADAVEDVVRNFCNWSGARLNRAKSHVLWLSKWSREETDGTETLMDRSTTTAHHATPFKNPPTITWAQPFQELKVLGVPFTATTRRSVELAWHKATINIEATLNSSKSRNLTLLQRVTLIKGHVLSTCIHLARVWPCPQETAEKITSSIGRFIWSGTAERPKPGAVYRKPIDGGLGLPKIMTLFECLHARATLTYLCQDCGFPAHADILNYWLAQPLREETGRFRRNSRPYSMAPPTSLLNIVQIVKKLNAAGVQFQNTPLISHKKAYELLTADLCTKGRVEERKPQVDWKLAWSNAARLPPHLRDLMFKINHDILPTKARLKRMKRDPGTCGLCQNTDEDLQHIFFKCPARADYVDAMLQFTSSLNILPTDCDNLLHLAVKPGNHCKTLANSFCFMWDHQNQFLTKEMWFHVKHVAA